MFSSPSTVQRATRTAVVSSRSLKRRYLHGTYARRAITNFEMPAMSPTMTEGGIASWKKKEGESFAGGDVLLEIETDKATIDVEAQDDGIVGKILLPDGSKNVPVGKVIALLAEEGDDISNLEAPKEEPKKAETQPSSSTSAPPSPSPSENSAEFSQQESTQTESPHSHVKPSHSKPLFPSVYRLLAENGVSDSEKIKGTGVRGMLTKGDVLAFLGKASGPLGTFKEAAKDEQQQSSKPKSTETALPDGPALRRLIVSNMLQSSIRARNAVPAQDATFDALIKDYIPTSSTPLGAAQPTSIPQAKKGTSDYFDGLI